MTISSPVADTENQPRRDTDWRLFLRLASYATRSKRLLIISIALLVPLAVSGAVQPILIGQAISVIRAEPTYQFLQGLPLSTALNVLAVLLMLTITFRLGLQSVQGYLVTKVGQIITTDIRNDLFVHVTSLAVRFFDRTPVGKLMTRLTSDVEALGEVFSSGAIGIVSDLFSILVIAIFMFTMQWQLALMLVLMMIPIAAIIIYFQNQFRIANYTTREELSDLNAQLQENLTGIGVVQLFRRERFNSELFNVTNKCYIKAVDKTIFYDSAVSATLEWIALVAIAAVLWMGGQSLLQGTINFGTLSAFILFAQRLFDPLRQFAEKFTAIQAGFTAVERISDILNEPIEIKDPISGAKEEGKWKKEEGRGKKQEGRGKREAGRREYYSPLLMAGHPEALAYNLSSNEPELVESNQTPVTSEYRLSANNQKSLVAHAQSKQAASGEIQFDNVWFAYKENEYVLQDLNFTIKSGEKVALVGPTGAGKSSIIRLLCRLYEPTRGRILIDGIDIRDLPQAELRRHVGVIIQDGFLFAGDVKSNISLGESYSMEEIRAAAEKTNVARLIEELPQGYDTQLRERGTNLSGGQKQLLAFARAAIRNPSILVLDEATASLDVGTEALIQEALERLMADRTAIIIAHRLSTIRNVDRILVLKRGQLVESGSHEELLQQEGLYASLYKLQMLGS
ncbi:MAG: ABC transporter ATP-binding protein [Microcoleus sp. PH2017_01_SCD_O_A]|uniref:ABC transporter ATP-binding protein n=1 Tax=Microcoleus sp. PH2017_01_SCD_O_A TaxID=2798812 RepID=UPI001DC1D0E7|nr:ABC transporter ATP-binding protein [Microcoleus sp. PH2017_01_SCD_O_A]MCC3419883.1 ABC transporter ATP-binding protein [Microcoleus sp. PH2017_07_MST_O_A]TAE51218.1 MAG: ABC transporter ATP-binding protein [Oscillatoriales cyanobacterium]MCC3425025.1 ABC transporter ATP-binding protein [Microcoleus sp. PH2017_01_SCD_O_A]TAE68111.1 MAG: ABC transporter ATP-binding protein [Oscillatoriales cyanobacterium]TAG65110.1 MAG: ABC transporter ATP-binding protein [Oscillatoriales cyanobacterium]